MLSTNNPACIQLHAFFRRQYMNGYSCIDNQFQ